MRRPWLRLLGRYCTVVVEHDSDLVVAFGSRDTVTIVAVAYTGAGCDIEVVVEVQSYSGTLFGLHNLLSGRIDVVI